jgi:predicted dehydrogenase
MAGVSASTGPGIAAGQLDLNRPVRRICTAVVGTGFVGPHHIDAVRRGGYADVVAVVGSDRERTAARAASLGVDRATTDLTDILRDPSIDVVHICTPNHTHVALARAVLEAGKHLVLEKPVALDVASAIDLANLADRSGCHTTVALTYRGYPMVRRARAAIATGELGDVRLVHGAYLQDWLARPSDYNWRLEPAAGGPSRAVADIGTHWFDTAEFVTGRRVESVLADLATFIPTRLKPLDGRHAFESGTGPSERVDVTSEDAATILVRFEGGARGAAVISQVSPGHKNGFTLDVDGSKRSLSWAQERPEHLWIRAREDSRLVVRDATDGTTDGVGIPALPAGHPEGWGEALRDLLRPFYAAIAAGESPSADEDRYPTMRAGARGVAFVEAVLRSARSGRWASLSAE